METAESLFFRDGLFQLLLFSSQFRALVVQVALLYLDLCIGIVIFFLRPDQSRS